MVFKYSCFAMCGSHIFAYDGINNFETGQSFREPVIETRQLRASKISKFGNCSFLCGSNFDCAFK